LKGRKSIGLHNSTLDAIDQRIIRLLDADARISLKKLSTQVGLSSPSVSERLRRLEEQGVIANFTIRVSPEAIGYQLQAIVRIRSVPGAVHKVERLIQQTPEFVECHKVTGEESFIGRLYVRSMEQLDKVLDRFQEIALTNTAMIKTTPVERRLPPLE
jgi:Lrp/AsnC family transcriptional regulator, leucine-responsive regulatory protein